MKYVTIILAAGKSSRIKNLCYDRPKCLLSVNGQPVLLRLCNQFWEISDKIYIVAGKNAANISSVLPKNQKVQIIGYEKLTELGNADTLIYGLNCLGEKYDAVNIIESDIVMTNKAVQNFIICANTLKFIATDRNLSDSDDKIYLSDSKYSVSKNAQPICAAKGKFLGVTSVSWEIAEKIKAADIEAVNYVDLLNPYLSVQFECIQVSSDEADEIDTSEDYSKIINNPKFKSLINSGFEEKAIIFNTSSLQKIVGIYDIFGAKIARKKGFDGLFLGSYQISAAEGVGDDARFSIEYIKNTAKKIRHSGITMPIIIDGLSGFDNTEQAAQAAEWINEYKIDAICIDDHATDRKCSLNPDFRPKLLPIEKYKKRIDLLRSELHCGCKIVARTELLNKSCTIDEAKKQIREIEQLNADIILPHYVKTDFAFIESVMQGLVCSKPLMIIPTGLLKVHLETWKQLGFTIVVYANVDIRSRADTLNQIYEEIIINNTMKQKIEDANIIREKYELI